MSKALVLLADGAQPAGMRVATPLAETGRFAVRELRKYLRQVSGLTFPALSGNAPGAGARITLTTAGHRRNHALLTDPKSLEFCARVRNTRSESFGIQTQEHELLIVGVDEKGLLNGVYAFLERFAGIRWLDPDKGGEFVPTTTNLTLPAALELVEEPQFRFRAFFCGGLDVLDWAAKNRMNTAACGIESWQKRQAQLGPELRRRGMKLWVGGHDAHNFLTGEQYFAAHPEFFALLDGQRRPTAPGAKYPCKICYSNPGALEVYTRNVLAYLEAHPEVTILALWPTDGGGFCECDECRKEDLSKLIFRFTCGVARAVGKHAPDVLIEHLSYGHRTLIPPRGVKPPPNLTVAYCPYWDRSRAHPLVDARQSHPAYIDRTVGNHRAVCRNIEAWSKLAPHLSIFSYYSDQIIKRALYVPVPEVIRKDLRYYRALGVEGLLDCTCFRDLWWLDSLNLYVLAKMLWNPDDDLEAAVAAFYQACFGPAAPFAAAFGVLLKRILTTPLYHGFLVRDCMICGADALHVAPFKPELDLLSQQEVAGMLAQAQACVNRAVKAAAQSAALIRQRVRRLQLALDYFGIRWRVYYHLTKARHSLDTLKTARPRERAASHENACLALREMDSELRTEKRFLDGLGRRERTAINADAQLRRWQGTATLQQAWLAEVEKA